MPAPATCEQFLELVEKSLIVDRERLDTYFQQKPALPPDARQLANQFWRDGLLTFYQARMLLTGKYKGFVFGKYKVLEQIGSGGEGNVYLCEHLLMRRRVAVKVLPIDRASDPALLERFYREARAAAALDHPNIVRVHDIDHEGELHFLVMEYVDGSSLQKIIKKKGPMEILRAVNYVRQVAIGLQHVHKAGLVHRDIKPGNLLLDRYGTVKILDLGLARFFQDSKDALTQQFDESAVLGTADYISPEQGMNSHTVDIRADIYSLGATFYFMLAGRAPFEGGTVTQKLLFHQMREPEPIRSIRVAVPEPMAAALHTMLAKDPAQRFQTPAEVVEALDPWLHELPPPAEEEMPKLSLAANINPADAGPLSKTLSTIGLSSAHLRRTPDPASTKKMPSSRTLMQIDNLPVAEVLAEAPPANLPVKANGAVTPAARPKTPAPIKRPASIPPPPSARERTGELRRPLRKKRFRLKAAAADRRVQYIALGSAALLVLGVVAYFVLPLIVEGWSLSKPVSSSQLARPNAPAKPATPVVQGSHKDTLTLYVSKHGACRTLRDGLNKATPGSRIIVFAQDGYHEELAAIDGKVPNDITIEGEALDGKTLVWRAPASAGPGDALLRIANAEGLKFKGIAFEGQDRVDDLVVLSGRCAGVSFEGTTFAGFRRRGVVFRDCEGETRKPVSLTRVRVTTSRDTEAALYFDGTNRDIDVRDCRVEGPFRSAFQLAGPTEGIGFHRNRIYRTVAGLLYRKANPAYRARIEIVANTFYEVAKGLHFETLPPAGDKNDIVVQHNLFARCPTPAVVDDFNPEPDIVTAQWIWHDEPGDPAKAAPPGSCYFRKTVILPEQTFVGVNLNIVCDDAFVVYVNGQQVGQGDFSPSTRRVFGFDVSRQLQRGKNVIAVAGTNRNNGRGATPAGLFVQLSTPSGANSVLAVSDGTWKSSKTNDPGWQTAEFNDQAWQPARVLASYGKGDASWQNLVWDSVLALRIKGSGSPFQNPATNVRDSVAKVAFPPLEWLGMDVTLPTDTRKDKEFLRYKQNHPLAKAGPKSTPIGAPPVE